MVKLNPATDTNGYVPEALYSCEDGLHFSTQYISNKRGPWAKGLVTCCLIMSQNEIMTSQSINIHNKTNPKSLSDMHTHARLNFDFEMH